MRIWTALDGLKGTSLELQSGAVAQLFSGNIEELLCWVQVILGDGYGGVDAEKVLDHFCDKHVEPMLKAYSTEKGPLGHFCRRRLRWACGAYRARTKATFSTADESEPVVCATVEQNINISELKELVQGVLDSLPPEDALVIGFFYLHELSIESIAARLHVNVSAARVRLFRARRRAAKLLEQEGFDKFDDIRSAFYV